MKLNSQIYAIVFSIILSTSCKPTQQIITPEKSPNITGITLLYTGIENFSRPAFPLIDAGVFNAKTDKLAEQIKEAQISAVERYQKIVSKGLAKTYNCEVKTAQDIYNTSNFKNLVAQYRNDSAMFNYNKFTFNQSYIAPHEVNVLDMNKGKMTRFLKSKKKYAPSIAEIFKYIDTEYLAISSSKLYIPRVGSFGVRGYIKLETSLYLFDRMGNIVASSFHYTPNRRITGSKLHEYTSTLDLFDAIFETTLKKNLLNYNHRRK